MTVPCLLLTFATLFAYYRFFHPWKSEGISVGFTPRKEHGSRPVVENDYDEPFNEDKPTNFKSSKTAAIEHSSNADGGMKCE